MELFVRRQVDLNIGRQYIEFLVVDFTSWHWAASILQVFYCRALLEQLAALQPQNGLHFVINAHLSFFFPLPSLWPESIFMLFPTVVGGQGDTTSPFWLALLCAF